MAKEQILPCPVCGENAVQSKNLFGDPLQYYCCCGVECLNRKTWNQYAAATRLALAEAWYAEIMEVHQDLNDMISSNQVWFTVENIRVEAKFEITAAKAAVKRLF